MKSVLGIGNPLVDMVYACQPPLQMGEAGILFGIPNHIPPDRFLILQQMASEHCGTRRWGGKYSCRSICAGDEECLYGEGGKRCQR